MYKFFKDLKIGETFFMRGKMYIKLPISYDFHGAYNAENVINKNDRQYLDNNESVKISD